MTRLLRTTVLTLYAASLIAAVVALCPCPMDVKADAHACCAKTGLKAATSDCCRTPTLQAKVPALPERAALAPLPAAQALAPSLPLRAVVAVARSAEPARTLSPPAVLRI